MLKKTLERKKGLRVRRKLRVRGRIFGVTARPRVSVFKSNRYLYAQAINDESGETIASFDGKKSGLGNNKDDAKKAGKIFADSLKESNIKDVVFDRNGYLYHGVVASFADSLRENGITL